VTDSTSNLWARVSPYLDEALELDAHERVAWLERIEASQPHIAAELRMLLELEAANRASGFMERSPVTAEDLVGRQIGPYEIERLLGRGGMGSVWLGRRNDGKFEGRAALKILNRRGLGKDAERHIRHEANLLARLSHAHIARLFDAGVRDNGQPYLILEYVEGVPIDRYCEAHRLTLQARLSLFLSVLDAVAHAHAHLVVHRDLKPGNVLVTPEGVVKLLDFGVASLETGEQVAGEQSMRQALTPGYASPEQLRGEPPAAASDVYALGVLLHVLVTGAHPYGTSATHTELIRSTLTKDAAPASERLPDASERRRVHGDLDAIIARALSRDPSRRYATAAELAGDLRAYLGNLPVRARPATRVYIARKFAQRHWGGVLSVMLTLLVLLGATVATTFQTLEARRQRDFARMQLGRAEAINDFNYYIVNDAGPSGEAITVRGLLARAEHVLERQQLSDANRVALLTSVGQEYEAQGDHASGLRILNEAYRLSRQVSDPSARAGAACELAFALAETENQRSSELIAEGLGVLPDAPEFALDRADCLERAKHVAVSATNMQLAVRHSQEAIETLTKVPFPHAVAQLHADAELASALNYAGRYRESAVAFESGWPRLVALGRDDTIGAGIWLNNWAADLLNLGRPLDAERLLRRAIALEQGGRPDQPVTPMRLNNLARALLDLAHLDEAADCAVQAVQEAKRLGNPTVTAQSQLWLAKIYLAQHDPVRASAVLDEGEPAIRKLFPPGHFALALLTAERALIAQERGDLQAAQTMIDDAIGIASQAEQQGKAGPVYQSVFLTYRADIELAAHHLESAEADLHKTLDRLLTGAHPEDYSIHVGRAQLTLARVLSAEARVDESREAARLAAEQLAKSAGEDHPETRAAKELGANRAT
jgi:hypothetical protein